MACQRGELWSHDAGGISKDRWSRRQRTEVCVCGARQLTRWSRGRSRGGENECVWLEGPQSVSNVPERSRETSLGKLRLLYCCTKYVKSNDLVSTALIWVKKFKWLNFVVCLEKPSLPVTAWSFPPVLHHLKWTLRSKSRHSHPNY